jgi:acyl-coenzyme A thioesterase PaaI-like protein
MKTIFKTEKKESLKSKFKKLTFNYFPAYRRTGGRVCFASEDWKEVHIKLSHTWRTRNYVGSIFGGSIYGALDPIYMVQLINILGLDYVVWDKSAHIKFIKPIKTTVYARFLLTENFLEEIKEKVNQENEITIDLKTHFQDKEGTIYAEVNKTIYIADKKYYKNKKAKR